MGESYNIDIYSKKFAKDFAYFGKIALKSQLFPILQKVAVIQKNFKSLKLQCFIGASDKTSSIYVHISLEPCLEEIKWKAATNISNLLRELALPQQYVCNP